MPEEQRQSGDEPQGAQKRSFAFYQDQDGDIGFDSSTEIEAPSQGLDASASRDADGERIDALLDRADEETRYGNGTTATVEALSAELQRLRRGGASAVTAGGTDRYGELWLSSEELARELVEGLGLDESQVAVVAAELEAGASDRGVGVCDNGGASSPSLRAANGLFCDTACQDAYTLR